MVLVILASVLILVWLSGLRRGFDFLTFQLVYKFIMDFELLDHSMALFGGLWLVMLFWFFLYVQLKRLILHSHGWTLFNPQIVRKHRLNLIFFSRSYIWRLSRLYLLKFSWKLLICRFPPQFGQLVDCILQLIPARRLLLTRSLTSTLFLQLLLTLHPQHCPLSLL